MCARHFKLKGTSNLNQSGGQDQSMDGERRWAEEGWAPSGSGVSPQGVRWPPVLKKKLNAKRNKQGAQRFDSRGKKTDRWKADTIKQHRSMGGHFGKRAWHKPVSGGGPGQIRCIWEGGQRNSIRKGEIRPGERAHIHKITPNKRSAKHPAPRPWKEKEKGRVQKGTGPERGNIAT